MRYRITIDRIVDQEMFDAGSPAPSLITQVYQQTFDELNVAEMITRLNHVPVKRPRKAKASK